MRFVDTNVLLYAISTVSGERRKAERARQILNEDDLATSVQALQEFYVQSTRAAKKEAISHEQAVQLVEAFCRFPIQETTLELVQAALSAKARFQISYWDAAIVEAARAQGCRELLTEDLNHGQEFGSVRVVNPFLGVESAPPSRTRKSPH